MDSVWLDALRRVPVTLPVVTTLLVASVATAQTPEVAPATSSAPDSSAPPPAVHAPVTTDDADPVEVFPSGHAAVGIGGAVGGSNPGFRLGLDASLGIAVSARSDHWGAWTLAPSIATGFGKYPTYATLDFGRVFFASSGQYGAFGGALATVGPAVRIASDPGAGGELSFGIYLIFVQVGVRAIAIVTDRPELQIQGTVGLGLF